VNVGVYVAILRHLFSSKQL